MFSRFCRDGVLLALVGASSLLAGETTLEIDEEDPFPFLEASFSARSGDVVKKKSHQEGHK